MSISTISYWFIEAFSSMKKNIKNVLISVSTMIATMLIVAVGYIILINSNHIIEQKQENSSKIMAFLKLDVTEEQIKNIETIVKATDGVSKVEYISQDEAIQNEKNENPRLTAGYTEEELKTIFQAYYRITFETLEAENEVVRTLRSLPGVGTEKEDVYVSESAQDSIKKAKSIKIIAITSMILIIELSVFLMINSTKLMLYARRKEISIMKYVGAKDSFVRMPFAIEGIITSLLAVAIVILIVTLCYGPVIDVIGKRANYNYLELASVIENLKTILIVIGCFIGAFGSTMSMNKYLDV